MRRPWRRKLILYLLIVSNFFLCICYLISMGTEDVVTTQIPTEEDIATEAIRRAVGVKGSNASQLVLPFVNTVVIEPSSDYCQKEGSNVYVLFMVISSPGNTAARNAIRSNLKVGVNQLNQQRWDGDTRRNNSVLFFSGDSGDLNTQRKLEDEAALYEDMVIDNVEDTYLNLTVKVLRMFKWVQRSCPLVKFVLKLDDDVHLNLLKFLHYLGTVSGRPHEAENLVGGYHYTNKTPVRTVDPPYGKWFAPPEVWADESYPDFIGGPAYVLGAGALHKIYNASLSRPLLHLEDVFVTGVIGNALLGLKLSGIPGIVSEWNWISAFAHSSCYLKDKLLVHSLSPREIKCWAYVNWKDYKCNSWPLVFSAILC